MGEGGAKVSLKVAPPVENESYPTVGIRETGWSPESENNVNKILKCIPIVI
jgi:hypothetical protein